MRLWVKTFDDDVHPSIGVITYATVLRHQMAQMKSAEELAAHFANMPDPARRMRQMSVHEDGMQAAPAAQALNQLDGVLTRMDQHLETVPWLGGDTYSLADCAAAPYILRLDQLQFSRLWSDGRRHLEGWYSRVSKRNSFQTLLENYMSQSLQELFREYGRRTWPKVEEILAVRA
jgi:glutathione S-transferase